jgi:hypothetical protein
MTRNQNKNKAVGKKMSQSAVGGQPASISSTNWSFVAITAILGKAFFLII